MVLSPWVPDRPQLGPAPHGAPPPGVGRRWLSCCSQCLPSAGKPEGKAADKAKLAVKSAGLQRSSSDAGRDRLGDAKKPPSGIARPSTSGSFGYKKPPPATGTATVVQTGGSATLGKAQKSSGIPVKPANGRKTSLDVSNSVEPGFLAPGARSNIQYRSLPRPAKSSSMSVTGGRGGPRPVSSSIDPSLLSSKPAGLAPSRLKEPSKVAGGRAAPAPVNQTDREKEKAKAKAEALGPDGLSLKSVGSPESTPRSQAGHAPAPKLAELPPTPLRYVLRMCAHPARHGLRQPTRSGVLPSLRGAQSPGVPKRMRTWPRSQLPAAAALSLEPTRLSCPRFPRAAAKSFVKPPSLANLDKVNSNSLDLPASGDAPAPKATDLHAPGPAAGGPLISCFTPSPAPILNINSASFSQGLELMSGFGVPKEPRMYPKLSGLHRSMESLQMPMSLPGTFPSGAPAPGSPAPPTAPAAEDAEELAWSGSPRAGQLDR